MSYLIRDIILWAFKSVITLIKLEPGDVIICYDSYISHQLSKLNTIPLPFKVPIIDGSCNPGEEHEILRKLSFKDFNQVWNMAYNSYAEEQWKIAQDRYYLPSPHPSHPPYPLLRRFLRKLENAKLKLVEKVGNLGQKPSVKLSEPTSQKLGLIDGKGERSQSELQKRQSQL